MLKKTERYNDIIHLPAPKLEGRDPMPVWERAAQFSPFAALTGYEDVIREAGRFTAERTDLDEDYRTELNQKLNRLAELTEPPQATQRIILTWFEPDSLKLGGEYCTREVVVRRVDRTYHLLELEDRSMIEIEQIYNLWWDEKDGNN